MKPLTHTQISLLILVIFISYIGIAMPYPIFAPMFYHPLHDGMVPEAWSEQCRGLLLGITLGAYPLGAFVGAPILGYYADRIGRKPVLIGSLAFAAIAYAFSAIAIHYNWLSVLILSRTASGFMEGNIAIARAVITDSSPQAKVKLFARIGAASSLGYVIGPVLAGVLSDHQLVSWFNLALPFALASGLLLLLSLVAYFCLQETLLNKNSQHIRLSKQFNLYQRLKRINTSPAVKLILISSTVFTFAVDLFYEFGPVYLTAHWQYNTTQISWYTFVLAGTLTIGYIYLIPLLRRFLSLRSLAKVALAISAAALLALVLFPTPIIAFILFALLGFLIALGGNSMNVQISDAAAAHLQSETMGTQVSLRMLGDGLLCLAGGALLLIHIDLPLLLASFAALGAFLYYSSQTKHGILDAG